MLVRERTLRHPNGAPVDLPLLVPAFTSKGFPFLQQGARLDLFTAEHALSVGEYGALTIVIPEAGDGDLQPARWR